MWTWRRGTQLISIDLLFERLVTRLYRLGATNACGMPDEGLSPVAEAFYDAADAIKENSDASVKEAANRVISLTASAPSSADPAGPMDAPAAIPDSSVAPGTPARKRASFLDRLKGKGDKSPAKTGSQLAPAPGAGEMVEYISEDGTITT